jgi:hypothetical protein
MTQTSLRLLFKWLCLENVSKPAPHDMVSSLKGIKRTAQPCWHVCPVTQSECIDLWRFHADQPTCELRECVCSQSVARDLLFQETYDLYFRQLPSTAHVWNTTKLRVMTTLSQPWNVRPSTVRMHLLHSICNLCMSILLQFELSLLLTPQTLKKHLYASSGASVTVEMNSSVFWVITRHKAV